MKDIQPFKRYLTPPQYAKRIGISPDRIRKAILSGQIEALNLNNGTSRKPRFRITEEACRKFEKSLVVTPDLSDVDQAAGT